VRAGRRVREHQAALQAIADENDGHRFAGFPGYGASVDYVVETLRAAGYDPEVQPFDYLAFQPVGPSALQQVAPNAISYVEGTDFGAITQSDRGDARLPTGRASPPGTSRCCSVAPARSSSRRRTRRRPAPSGS